MLKKIIFFWFLTWSATNIIIGQASIVGLVQDEQTNSISFANILILNAQDSSLVKGELTDEMGLFNLDIPSNASLILSVSYIGYDDYYSDSFTVNDGDVYNHEVIKLTEGVALEEVQITARKPLFEQKIDRMVVNVASSITSAGSTALEVLERSPGVIVNRQSGALSLIGKDGVVIMINGKITYQPAESIVQMLDGMSSDNISTIELITTPPANFDAEGIAGFINIVLKERTDIGFNGNLSAMIGYGEGGTSSSNVNLNYRKDKLSLFSTYSFLYKAQKQVFYNFRSVDFSGQKTISELTTDRDPQQVNHNLRIGADYELSKNTVVGVLASAYNNKWTMDAFNSGTTTKNDNFFSAIELTNSELNQWKHFLANFNLEHKLTDRQKVNFDYDYLVYEDNNPVDYDINNLSSTGLILSNELTRSRKFTPIAIQVAQLDYKNEVSEKINLSVGVKGAFSNFENDVSTETFDNGMWNFLDQFTNESDLDEKI